MNGNDIFLLLVRVHECKMTTSTLGTLVPDDCMPAHCTFFYSLIFVLHSRFVGSFSICIIACAHIFHFSFYRSIFSFVRWLVRNIHLLVVR